MIIITDTITIAVITIAIIAIAIITIAIITISPGPNAHTYAHTPWEASSTFSWKIWVGDLLSPRSNCLPFLQNLRLQLSTPWLWGIVRFRLSGRAKDEIQTMIETDVRLSASGHMPQGTHQILLSTCHLPQASQCLASASHQVSGSSM